MSQKWRTEYGGHLGNWATVVAAQGADDLKCFTCGDESLYHDAYAYWHEKNDDLLCPACFKKKDAPEGYIRVLTYH